jgi:hypothetical protein
MKEAFCRLLNTKKDCFDYQHITKLWANLWDLALLCYSQCLFPSSRHLVGSEPSSGIRQRRVNNLGPKDPALITPHRGVKAQPSSFTGPHIE